MLCFKKGKLVQYLKEMVIFRFLNLYIVSSEYNGTTLYLKLYSFSYELGYVLCMILLREGKDCTQKEIT